MFLVELPELANLTTRYGFEDTLIISCVLHQLIDFWHRALAIPLGQPLQKVCCDMIALVPLITARTPMRGHEAGTKPNPIYDVGVQLRKWRRSSGQADLRTGDPLNQTAGTGVLGVVLVTVDNFVDQNPADLIRGAVHNVLA